jgi:PAS domain S-box-containing protein
MEQKGSEQFLPSDTYAVSESSESRVGALQASLTHYAHLYDVAPVGYATFGADCRVLEINLRGAQLAGVDRSTIVGKRFDEIVRVEPRGELSRHVIECITQHTYARSEVSFSREGDAGDIVVEVVSVPAPQTEGSVDGCYSVLIDVTERRSVERAADEARARAEQANQRKDDFLSLVAHELRSPLNAVLGWSQMLTSTPWDDTEVVRRGLEVIHRNAEAQRRLVEDILDLSRMMTGRLRIDRQRLALAPIVRSIVESMQPTAQDKGVALEMLPGPDAHVLGDSMRLQQVVYNLLSNAIRFTEKGGSISVLISVDTQVAAVSVRDTGCGIAPDELPRIFDRLWQAETSSSRRQGGIGLGLAVVKHIVELHGGRAIGDSPGLQRGSTFVVEIPRVPEE